MQDSNETTDVVFDVDQALVGVDQDLELLQELVQIFLEDCDRMVDELRTAVEAASADGIERGAHTLKGSVGVLAGVEVGRLAADLEQRGRAGDIADTPGLFAELATAVERLRTTLTEFGK